jgi:hypothetical protein
LSAARKLNEAVLERGIVYHEFISFATNCWPNFAVPLRQRGWVMAMMMDIVSAVWTGPKINAQKTR